MKRFKNIKTIIASASILLGLLIGNVAIAQVGGNTLWKLTGGAIQPVVSTWTIGSSANRVAKIWATDIDSTSLSIGSVSGNLDLGGFSLTNALGVTTTALTISGLADPAGVFLAVDPDGNVIATTTPSGSGSQTPLESDIDGATYSLLNIGKIGIGTTTPNSAITLYGDGGPTGGIAISSGQDTDYFNIYNAGGELTFADSLGTAGMVLSQSSGALNSIEIGVDGGFAGTISIGNSSSPVTFAGTTTMSALELTGADTGILFQSGKYQRNAPRWKDGASVVNATTTDEAYKIGNCLEPGVSVTLDNVVSIIATTTNTVPEAGITWNINIGANFYEVYDTLFDSDITTTSTSTQEEDTPDVTEIPAGYCWWFKPVSAQTTQIGAFNFNLYGYED